MQCVQSSHAMPFGAELQDDGRVRFRLWAPGAERVELCLERERQELALALERDASGWFEALVTAGPASRYQFQIAGQRVPDPAARFQPLGVHGPSEVIDPRSWSWSDTGWRGIPWEEVVIYELHVGAFTPEGDYAALQERLDYLRALGITAIELMPLAAFPGRRNWGYDAVLPFAPAAAYGRPEDLKRFIQAAHQAGLAVYHDVIYNHFGPEGNYLHLYAPAFFSRRHNTPWGAAINYDGPEAYWVRQFFIHQALYWLEEYHFDGLRLDAVHAIVDDSRPQFVEELAAAVWAGPGRERHIHLVLENDANQARYLMRDRHPPRAGFQAQWNDDIHHALHVAITGETGGYYQDYAAEPVRHLARCLGTGFAYQGERSAYRDGARRGEPSDELPPTAFVSFLQNHDQVGGRAFAERITRLAPPAAVRAATAIVLLAPQIPLLFMGQEWAAPQPFLFFCDFGPPFDEAVRAGRRREFARFPGFDDPARREQIPDPCAPSTFAACVLDWADPERAAHAAWLDFHRALLDIRRREIVPLLADLPAGKAAAAAVAGTVLTLRWPLAGGGALELLANLGPGAAAGPGRPADGILFATHDGAEIEATGKLPGWSVIWSRTAGPSV